MAGPTDHGSALMIALFASVVLSGLGLGLVMLTDTEGTIASNYRAGSQTMYAADAAVERVLTDVRLTPNWNDILSGATQSGFLDTTLTPTLPSNQPMNLTALTAEIQAASDTIAPLGPNNPRWKLFAYGRLSEMATINTDEYVVVWVSDDPADGDSNAEADTNGVLTVLAQAFGQRGIYRTVEATIVRTVAPADPNDVNNTVGQATVRILSWREIR